MTKEEKLMARNGFFDCMIIAQGGSTCRASDLYTKKDPFIDRPMSVHKGSYSREELEQQRIDYKDGKRD